MATVLLSFHLGAMIGDGVGQRLSKGKVFSMKPEEIGSWLLTEMQEFENRTPADLISKGETGRLWASLFYLRSGLRERD